MNYSIVDAGENSSKTSESQPREVSGGGDFKVPISTVDAKKEPTESKPAAEVKAEAGVKEERKGLYFCRFSFNP